MKIAVALEKLEKGKIDPIDPGVQVLELNDLNDEFTEVNHFPVQWPAKKDPSKQEDRTPGDVIYANNTLYAATKEGIVEFVRRDDSTHSPYSPQKRYSVDFKVENLNANAKAEGTLAMLKGETPLIMWGLRYVWREGSTIKYDYAGLQSFETKGTGSVLHRSPRLVNIYPTTDVLVFKEHAVYGHKQRVFLTNDFGIATSKPVSTLRSDSLEGIVASLAVDREHTSIAAITEIKIGEDIKSSVTLLDGVLNQKAYHDLKLIPGDRVTSSALYTDSFHLTEAREQWYHPQDSTHYLVIGTAVGNVRIYEVTKDNSLNLIIDGSLPHNDQEKKEPIVQITPHQKEGLSNADSKEMRLYFAAGTKIFAVDTHDLLIYYNNKCRFLKRFRENTPDDIVRVGVYDCKQPIARFTFMDG